MMIQALQVGARELIEFKKNRSCASLQVSLFFYKQKLKKVVFSDSESKQKKSEHVSNILHDSKLHRS